MRGRFVDDFGRELAELWSQVELFVSKAYVQEPELLELPEAELGEGREEVEEKLRQLSKLHTWLCELQERFETYCGYQEEIRAEEITDEHFPVPPRAFPVFILIIIIISITLLLLYRSYVYSLR